MNPYLTYQVDNEAIVIPENVDCVRAVTGLDESATASMVKTNASLGVTKEFLPTRREPRRDATSHLSHTLHQYV